MPDIQAWQHIYSNVEKEQSPQQRGGFQTLFYTKAGLTEVDISEMEGRLLYFPDKSEAEPVKRLFFSTASGKGVVAQIVPLPAPDQYGRKGRYLAHALVFAAADVARFGANPFRIFRHVTFFESIEQALAQGDFESGNIAPVTVSVPETTTGDVEAAGQWAGAELKKLALLALRAEEQTEGRQATTLAGEPAQIEAALEAAFLAVPTPLRPRCTFDTYFYRCNLVATFYWAIGLLEAPVSIKFVLVEAGARQVRGEPPTEPETAYERWALAKIEAHQLADIARQREAAYALGQWLDRQMSDEALPAAPSESLVSDLFGVNGPAVRSFLGQRIGEVLPAALVARAVDSVYRQAEPPALYRQLREGFAVERLLAALYDSYQAQSFAEPPPAELKALEQLLETTPQPLLALFVAYWRSPRRRLPAALEAADDETYRQFGQIALNLELVEPMRLLRPGRGAMFLDLYLASEGKEWSDLVAALIEAGEARHLGRLSGRVGIWSGRELTRVAKLIDDQAAVPESFKDAVEQAIAALPPKRNIRALIRAAWRRWPGLGEE